jgi:hypothetical protein
LESDPEWQAYLAGLERGGCFGRHAAGTAQHSALAQQATERYRRVQSYRRRTAELAAPALMVQRLLRVRRL